MLFSFDAFCTDAGQTQAKEQHMKKLAVACLLFSFAMLLAIPVQAQQTGSNASSSPATSAKASGKLVSLAGIVAADRKSLLCDKDNRTLAIANPEVLRGIEGQHATLRARLDSGTGELLVASAKPSRDERHAPRLDDAAFRK
jgi:hypothetical protein